MSCFVALQSKQETWSKNHDAHAVLHRPVRLDDRGPGRAIPPLAHWDDYGGTQLFRNAGQGAYVFATTHAQVDADGAPNAYHPDDVGLNCKTGTGFKGLIVRPMVAIRMATGGLPPSFRIRRTKRRATSSLTASSRDSSCRRRRSGTVPGRIWIRPSMSTPRRCLTWSFPAFHQKAGTGTLGDLGYAVNLDNGKTSAFIVAEVGPSDAKLGKCRLPWRRRWAGRTPIRARAPASRTARSPTWCFRKAGPIPRGPDQSTNRRPRPGPAQAVARAWRPSRFAAPTRNSAGPAPVLIPRWPLHLHAQAAQVLDEARMGAADRRGVADLERP